MTLSPPKYPYSQTSIPYLPPRRPHAASLHTLDIHFARPSSPTTLWIVYVHGGAWRDPRITSSSILPALPRLLIHPFISAVVSLEYRLSPHPEYPNYADDYDQDENNAVERAIHPRHVLDVCSALAYLCRERGMGRNYLLVGHSCGAMMAVQAVMRRWRSGVGSDDETDFVKPVGVVGVEGIYDLVGLRDRHADESVYEEIVVNAFGPDERVWEAASPTGWLRGKHIAGLAEAWPEGRLLLVAHSPEDELVEKEQATGLLQVLGLEGNASQQRRDEILWINGKHDQVWEEGVELTRAISRAIELLHAT